jgi:hypothetical protein
VFFAGFVLPVFAGSISPAFESNGFGGVCELFDTVHSSVSLGPFRQLFDSSGFDGVCWLFSTVHPRFSPGPYRQLFSPGPCRRFSSQSPVGSAGLAMLSPSPSVIVGLVVGARIVVVVSGVRYHLGRGLAALRRGHESRAVPIAEVWIGVLVVGGGRLK